ncbi:MAG: hypothetical protein KY464_01430 [Gemmatimonadetes bacterium]|nr:hypothetical protein [Gemmatimonadota bacterium]
MSSHLRSIVALGALLAFALFWVEGVWASMCSPAMDMGVPAMAMAAAGEAVDAAPTDMQEPADSDEHPADSSHCPLAQTGPASCALSAPLAARITTPEVASPEAASLLGSPDHAKDLLLAIALFHPPKP